MTTTHIFFLGLFLTALIGAVGWIITIFYTAFTNLIETVANAVLKLETTIAKMDERFNTQNKVCDLHKEAFEKQTEEVRGELGKVEERVGKVEVKLDKHIDNHPSLKIRRQ